MSTTLPNLPALSASPAHTLTDADIVHINHSASPGVGGDRKATLAELRATIVTPDITAIDVRLDAVEASTLATPSSANWTVHRWTGVNWNTASSGLQVREVAGGHGIDFRFRLSIANGATNPTTNLAALSILPGDHAAFGRLFAALSGLPVLDRVPDSEFGYPSIYLPLVTTGSASTGLTAMISAATVEPVSGSAGQFLTVHFLKDGQLNVTSGATWAEVFAGHTSGAQGSILFSGTILA